VATDDEFLRRINEQFGQPGELPPEEVEARRSRELNEKEVKIVGVYDHPRGPFVLLRDSRGRAMPIWVGNAEALSISIALEGTPTPRPLTHELMKIVLERLGGIVESALVDDLYNNTYYAKLSVRTNGRVMDIDCRPSDAIAVALRCRVPIYVADAVLEEAQVEWQEE
jgi:bifunctional DNase/RNase